MIDRWSAWRPFPDPSKGGILAAPFGPGCYELRKGKKLVLYGMGRNVAARMTSLLPKPHGTGIRKNSRKRDYVRRHRASIKYRTRACSTPAAAAAFERDYMRSKREDYCFGT
jgi:hypothetical protein